MSGANQFQSAGKVGKDLVTDTQNQCLYSVYMYSLMHSVLILN